MRFAQRHSLIFLFLWKRRLKRLSERRLFRVPHRQVNASTARKVLWYGASELSRYIATHTAIEAPRQTKRLPG